MTAPGTQPSVRLEEFDLWRPGYGLATVSVFIAGTTQLAAIFLDQACTQPAANPQTLQQQTFYSISYGKWQQPLYTQTSYDLQINSVDRTGIVGVPLTTLEGQDASLATVIPTGGSVAGNLDDILGRHINVLDYGEFLAVGTEGASAVGNTNTLNAAVNAAAAQGGGYVEIPAGTFQFITLNLPGNVVIRGQGQNVSTLQSTSAGNVVVITGALAGFTHICLDGLNQVTGSAAIFSSSVDQIIFEDVLIQNFDYGVNIWGGTGHHWYELFISNCIQGVNFNGWSNNGGSAVEFCHWQGGGIQYCTVYGILLNAVDELVDHNTFENIDFDNNTGIAVLVSGAHATVFKSCSWYGNTTDLQLEDGSPINQAGTNTVVGCECQDGSFIGTGSNGGAINLADTLQNVAFRRCEFTNETITITDPDNNIIAQDCREVGGVAFAGVGTAWLQSFTTQDGFTVGLTSGTTATPVWSMQLASGETVLLDVSTVARCRNNTDVFGVRFLALATCSPAQLNYTELTVAFTAGNVVTGSTSGATARIVSVNTGSNYLQVQDIDGTFLNGEIITDSGGGSATVNGPVIPGSVTVSTTDTLLSYSSDTNWNVGVAAAAQQVAVNVTGDTDMNVEWFVNVAVLSSSQIE